MAIGKLQAYVLATGFALFTASLLLPGIVFKPDARSNPRFSECAYAVKDNVMCESFSFGGAGLMSCGTAEREAPGKIFVDKSKILKYCNGWDLPVAATDYGYRILQMGFLGALVGMFAWFANPLMLIALVLSVFENCFARMIGPFFSVFAVALGLQAFIFDAVPFNESSMKPDNLNYVDYLGFGFYLWMSSLAAFATYCFLKMSDTAVRH